MNQFKIDIKIFIYSLMQTTLENFDEYPMYELPIFKATAIKYGFENPIGEDSGSEDCYNEK